REAADGQEIQSCEASIEENERANKGRRASPDKAKREKPTRATRPRHCLRRVVDRAAGWIQDRIRERPQTDPSVHERQLHTREPRLQARRPGSGYCWTEQQRVGRPDRDGGGLGVL